MLTTDFDEGASGSASLSSADAMAPSLRSECETLARLARAHFDVAAALIVVSGEDGRRMLACDGAAPRGLPPELFAAPPDERAPRDALAVIDDTREDPRFLRVAGVAQWPRFCAACSFEGGDRRVAGAIYLFDVKPRSLNPAQRGFLRDLSALAAGALYRAQADCLEPSPASKFDTDHELVTLALTGSGTGLWDRDVVTGEIHYSPAWKAMLGYEPHELSTRIEDAYERVHPADLAHVQATMQAHFDNKTDSYAVEHRIRCKDGSYKWICSRGKVVSRDSEGRAQRMVGTTTDITTLRETAASLQHTIDLVTNLTNEVPGLVFQYRQGADGHAAFPYTSDGIEDVYELSSADVVLNADAVEARIDARDLAAYRQSLRDSAAALTPWHLEYRVNLPRQGLCWRQGDARPQRMPDGSTLWHGFITDATDRKRIEAELHELATIDHLTQLPNRRHFTFQSEAELARLRQTGGDAAVLMLDLDHFKTLNDRWGHALGDRALTHFAQLLRAQARTGDLVGRIGGEEFAVVLPHASTGDAVAFAERVQRRIAEAPLVDTGKPIALTVSIGVDGMRSTDTGAYQALSRCDKALYVAKERGRNRIEVYEERSADTA